MLPGKRRGVIFAVWRSEEGSTLNFAWGTYFLLTSPINVPGIHEVVSGFPRTWGNHCYPIWMGGLHHFTPRLEMGLSQEA